VSHLTLENENIFDHIQGLTACYKANVEIYSTCGERETKKRPESSTGITITISDIIITDTCNTVPFLDL